MSYLIKEYQDVKQKSRNQGVKGSRDQVKKEIPLESLKPGNLGTSQFTLCILQFSFFNVIMSFYLHSEL